MLKNEFVMIQMEFTLKEQSQVIINGNLCQKALNAHNYIPLAQVKVIIHFPLSNLNHMNGLFVYVLVSFIYFLVLKESISCSNECQ